MAITPQGFRVLVRIVEALAFLTIFVLMALQSVPLTFTNNDVALHYATEQQAISQRIAKDTLILQYGSPSDHIQAISELQNMLPTWESDQKNLQSSHLPDVSQTLFVSSNTNYVAIDTAVRAILVRPQGPIDAVQAQIIRSQEHSYFIAVSQVANDLLQQEKASKQTLFFIEEGVCVILLAIKVTFVLTVETTVAGYLKRERAREQEQH